MISCTEITYLKIIKTIIIPTRTAPKGGAIIITKTEVLDNPVGIAEMLGLTGTVV